MADNNHPVSDGLVTPVLRTPVYNPTIETVEDLSDFGPLLGFKGFYLRTSERHNFTIILCQEPESGYYSILDLWSSEEEFQLTKEEIFQILKTFFHQNSIILSDFKLPYPFILKNPAYTDRLLEVTPLTFPEAKNLYRIDSQDVAITGTYFRDKEVPFQVFFKYDSDKNQYALDYLWVNDEDEYPTEEEASQLLGVALIYWHVEAAKRKYPLLLDIHFPLDEKVSREFIIPDYDVWGEPAEYGYYPFGMTDEEEILAMLDRYDEYCAIQEAEEKLSRGFFGRAKANMDDQTENFSEFMVKSNNDDQDDEIPF
jgi:hypothetical protein